MIFKTPVVLNTKHTWVQCKSKGTDCNIYITKEMKMNENELRLLEHE